MANVSRFDMAAKADVRACRAGAAGRRRGGWRVPSAWCWLAVALVLLCASLPGRPVETLLVGRQAGEVWRLPVPLGQTVVTRYIHSVEQTPVEDVYVPLGGVLYQWRTRSRSHNAGLPWKAPERGRFLTEGGWLVLEGGLPPWEAIRLRVGNATFGRNTLKVGSGPWIALYTRFPGERLSLSAGRTVLSGITQKYDG